MPAIGKHQTIIDFATQHLGSGLRAIEVAILNGVNITDELPAGTQLALPEVAINDKRTINYLQKNKIAPGTLEEVPASTTAEQGIGYWAIEEDFIIT